MLEHVARLGAMCMQLLSARLEVDFGKLGPLCCNWQVINPADVYRGLGF